MKNIKKPFLVAIALAIAGLMIVVSASAAIQIQTPTLKTKKQAFVLNKNPSAMIAGMEVAQMKGVISPVESPTAFPLAAVPVFPGYHPGVASDSLGNVVLGFEDDSPNVWFTASLDAGQTWLDDAVGWQITEPPELPDADSCGDGRFIGGMVPNYLDNEGSALYKVEVTDPGDLENGYTCPYWTWYDVGTGYTDFTAIAVAGYTATDPDENAWGFGGHAIIGDNPDSGADTNFFSYQFDDTGYAWIYRWTGINGCTATAHDIDPGNLYSYAAWNFNNIGDLDIYVSVMDFGTWEPYPPSYQIHPDVTDLTIEATGNDDYIDISALNDNIIVVSQRAGDIVAYYSTDQLDNVAESPIATAAVNPRIVHNGDLKATCTFIKDGSVYYSTTENGGSTWSTPEQVPDSEYVPEEYKAADVCGFGAAWMNEDDGNIYFGSMGNAPPGITTITGPIEVQKGEPTDYTFVATDPDGDDVKYLINWGDDSTEETGYQASGVPVVVSHTWAAKGTYTITARAEDINGLVGPPGTLAVTVPLNQPSSQQNSQQFSTPLFLKILVRLLGL